MTIRLRTRWAASFFVLAALAAGAFGQDKSGTAVSEFKSIEDLLTSLPDRTIRPLDAEAALLFTAVPLACVDDLQPKPEARPYFWQPTFKIVDNHDRTRAFFGCNDWATAVSATWTMVSLLKRYPDLPVGGLIREKLTGHLGRPNLEGELEYFRTAGNFQRPYGYAWFLKLYAELATWKDADGTRYAENAAPLARYFADSLVGYLVDLERPNRSAGQTNTAFMLGLLLDYVEITRDMTIGRAVRDAGRRIFLNDRDCGIDTEAGSPELISPCLVEAAVMSRILGRPEYTGWLDRFLPPAHSAKFKTARTIDLDASPAGSPGNNRESTASANTPAGVGRGAASNPRATWTGLAFTRAIAFSQIAAALPAGDPRAAVFKKLAGIHAEKGQQGLTGPAAFEAPWLGTLAVTYLAAIGDER